jgi:UDP-N-acetylglucosamine 4,6-dehydratase
MVRKVLEEMQGGELYVPLLPSFRVGDLASAMVPVGTDPRVDYINGHPGEKPHECMVSRDEAHLFRRLPDGFVHYINGRACGEALPTDFQYSSDTNTEWLDVDELRRRLRDIR